MVSKKKHEEAPVEGIVDGTEFVELKRDMQSAKVIAWLQYNQQQLIAGAITFVLLLVGYSLWQEQQQGQKEAAALMYIKAMNNPNQEEKIALFDGVVKEYPDSGYATLVRLQQSTHANQEEAKAALQALIESKGAPEFVWQAKLDLAKLYLNEGEAEQAESLLEAHMGTHYQQVRFSLLARLAASKEEKIKWIEKALAAETHDNELKAALESELATLQASK